MIRILKECRKQEQLTGNKLFTLETFSFSLPGLYKRGLVDFDKAKINNKEVVTAFITQKAKDYLDSLESNP